MAYLTFALKQNIAVVSFQTQSHFAIFYTWCAIQVKSFSAQIQTSVQVMRVFTKKSSFVRFSLF